MHLKQQYNIYSCSFCWYWWNRLSSLSFHQPNICVQWINFTNRFSNSKIETERKLKERNMSPRNFQNLTNKYLIFSACLHVMLPKSKDVVISSWTNNNKEELLTIHEHMESTPDFSVGLVLLIILNFWDLLFVCLCFVSFTQCCLWIDHSWLSLQFSLCGSNVYLLQQRTVHSNLYTADIFPVYNKGDGVFLNIIFHN